MNENRQRTNAITRRRILECATALGTVAVAGCLGDGPAGPGNEGGFGGNNGGNGDPSELVAKSIETTGSGCGSPNDETVQVDVSDRTVVVTGVLEAPNPCHEAVLKDVALVDGQLSLAVDVRSTLEEDESCIQCHGRVEYVVRIEPAAGEPVDMVDIEHATGDRHEIPIAFDDTDGGDDTDDAEFPELVSSAIETVDTDCSSGDDDRVDVESDGDTIVVTGSLSAPNPCHEAVLDDVAIEDETGRLSLVVDVRSTLDEGEVCMECVGRVDYEATIELTRADELRNVHVDHVTGGEHAVGWDRATDQ